MTVGTTFCYEGPSEYDPGLNLTVTDLEQILLALRRAQEAKIRFEGALLTGQHRVLVRWETSSDQRDADWLVITEIRRA